MSTKSVLIFLPLAFLFNLFPLAEHQFSDRDGTANQDFFSEEQSDQQSDQGDTVTLSDADTFADDVTQDTNANTESSDVYENQSAIQSGNIADSQILSQDLASTSLDSEMSSSSENTASDFSNSGIGNNPVDPFVLPFIPQLPAFSSSESAASSSPVPASTSAVTTPEPQSNALPTISSANSSFSDTPEASSTSATTSSNSSNNAPPATTSSIVDSAVASTSSTSVLAQAASDIFSTGAVTFRFDDGWASQLSGALPALDAAGIRGTFYIPTHQLFDDGFAGFMSRSDVQALAARGQEIGAHTQTHPHLPTLSGSALQREIAGSKTDLESLGITAQTFSYPYGEYTNTTLQAVGDAGFTSAVSTIETSVAQSADRYQIPSPSIEVSQSPETIKSMIDSAIAKHEWLIMTFHRIDTSGDQYSYTPENFREIVDYVKSHDIPTLTVSEGAAQLK